MAVSESGQAKTLFVEACGCCKIGYAECDEADAWFHGHLDMLFAGMRGMAGYNPTYVSICHDVRINRACTSAIFMASSSMISGIMG